MAWTAQGDNDTHTQPLVHVNGGVVGYLGAEDADMHQRTATERRPPSLLLPFPCPPPLPPSCFPLLLTVMLPVNID